MEYCKLQIGCMIIVLYVACIYIREKQIYQMKRKNVLFETILAAGIVGIFFDGATAYTVNHLAEIPASVNTFLHLCFLSFLDIFVFLMFLYMYDITRGLPQKRGERIGLFLPLLINIVVVIVFMPQLEYRKRNVYQLFDGNVCIYLFCDGGVVCTCCEWYFSAQLEES